MCWVSYGSLTTGIRGILIIFKIKNDGFNSIQEFYSCDLIMQILRL